MLAMTSLRRIRSGAAISDALLPIRWVPTEGWLVTPDFQASQVSGWIWVISLKLDMHMITRREASVAPFALLLLAKFATASPPKVIGVWYDDLKSPKYGDAVLSIEQEGDRYFLNRKNGDGSVGRHVLEMKQDRYFRVGDRFGANYRITPGGLELHDSQGFIRLAKPHTKTK